MDFLLLLKQLAYSFLMGGLLGLERERKSQTEKTPKIAGVRTFTLIAICGCVSQYVLEMSYGFGVAFVAVFLSMLALSYVFAIFKEGVNSATSEVALFLTFLIGFLNANNEFVLAALITTAIILLLISKEALHLLAKKITKSELNSIIKLILISFIILPILPNLDMGYLDFFNPYKTWLMVVLISVITMVSYVAIKVIGNKKGLTISGFLGGMVSSTAITLSFTNLSRKINSYQILAMGIIIANSAMFVRVLIEVLLVNQALAFKLIAPLVGAAAVGVFSTYYLYTSKTDEKNAVFNLKKPLDLSNAMKFGVFFALISFLVSFLNAKYGDLGVYFSSFISGLVDTDAIALSLANLAHQSLSQTTASFGIILAIIANSLSKIGFGYYFGSRKLANLLSLIIGLQIVAILLASAVSLMYF